MYKRLLVNLKRFLFHYRISISHTDIFEDILLKLANVKSIPKKSNFGAINKHLLYLAIKGIREDETNKLLNLFIIAGDTKATYRFDDATSAHYFEVSIDIMLSKILPLIKEEVKKMAQQSPSLLLDYQLKSNNSLVVHVANLIDTINEYEQVLKVDLATNIITNLTDKSEKLLTEYDSDTAAIFSIIKNLKFSLLNHALGIHDYYVVLKQWEIFNHAINQYNPINNMKLTHDIKKQLHNHCEAITPTYYYMTIPSTSLKNRLANAASRLQILSKAQLGLPDTIQALIVGFLADYRRGTCKFGDNATIIYPNNKTKEENTALEVYERRVFQFFKNKCSTNASFKKMAFHNHESLTEFKTNEHEELKTVAEVTKYR